MVPLLRLSTSQVDKTDFRDNLADVKPVPGGRRGHNGFITRPGRPWGRAQGATRRLDQPGGTEESRIGGLEITGPRDARLLSDGRAAAIWSLNVDAVLGIFAQQDSRWLIDEAFDIPETGATPAATPTA